MDLGGKRAKARRRAGRERRSRFVPALVLAAAAGLGAPLPAAANRAQVVGQVGCASGCLDSFEVKCAKASRLIEFRIEADNSGPAIARFQMTAIGTLPTAMDDGDLALFATTLPGEEIEFGYLVRPGSEGTIKALVAVSPVLTSGPNPTYTFSAECFSGETLGDFVSKKTTIEQRVDE
jgi:hypothetical protein